MQLDHTSRVDQKMESLPSLTGLNSIVGSVFLYVLYWLVVGVYRVWFHPLSKFPGEWLSSASYLPEMYHDIVKRGQYYREVERLHNKYGPIVRINPDEIHIRDSQFFDTLYTKSGRADKYGPQTHKFDNPTSAFGTIDADLHALRRAPLNPFFSRAKIIAMESIVWDKLKIFQRRIEEYKDKGEAFRIDRGYCALTGDIIMQYVFDMSADHLESPGFDKTFYEPFAAAASQSPVTTFFPWVPKLMKMMPRRWLLKVEPLYWSLFKLQDDLCDEVTKLKRQRDPSRAAGVDMKKKKNLLSGKSATIFDELLDSETLPPSEKTDRRLTEEAQAIVGAGLFTTAWALSVGSFHITNEPAIYERLVSELKAAIPDPDQPLRWTDLERLPYLGGCVRESIRLSHAVSGRTVRVFNKPLTYRDWVVPASTPVSMTQLDVGLDEEVFPEHDKFKPERWMNKPKTADGSSLERFMVTFGKGTRACLGINLAYAEMYIALATVFRKYRFQLHETDASDVQMAHDFLIPLPRMDSVGVQVRCVHVE